MTTQRQGKETIQTSKQDSQERLDVIGKNIMNTLGRPDNLHLVQVRALWGDHYRANVFVGTDLMSARIAHSYFVVADQDGKLVTSMPAINRKY